MWNDNESVTDFIDYSHLVSAVCNIIDNDGLSPCSIGIYGDWGSGKSSLMRMVESRYDDLDDHLIVKFNGWLFEGYEDAKTVLMARIVDELISKRKLSEKAMKYAAKLLKRIDWIKVMGTSAKYGASFLAAGPLGAAGVAATEALSKIGEFDYEAYVKKQQEAPDNDTDTTMRSNIQEFHKNFKNLIEETNIVKIIVFIDDLDRCSPDTIIGTLEAIKLFLFTEKTAFVIGADERLIKYAVSRRFPEVPGDNSEVGRDYLEKLIQYPIRIPPLSATELTTYINLLFSQLYALDADFEAARKKVMTAKQSGTLDVMFHEDNVTEYLDSPNVEFLDGISLCSQIVPILSSGLNGNPRQTKRFLNTLMIRIKMAESKSVILKKKVLAKLMLLEYFRPETFKNFHETQSGDEKGTIPILTNLERFSQDQKSNTSKKEQPLSTNEQTLIEDRWMRQWFLSEPQIANENLRPYFYFSRDKLFLSSGSQKRMSGPAQEVLEKLLSFSKVLQAAGKSEIKALSPGDASSIFEILAQKVRQEEDLKGNSRTLEALFDLVFDQPDLKSELLSFLDKFRPQLLPVKIITLAESVFKTTHPNHLLALMEKWRDSDNKPLSKIVKSKLTS